MNIRKFILIISSCLLIIGLIGCGNDESTSGKKAKQVVIHFSWWGDTTRNKVYNSIIKKFEKEHPNIIVKGQSGNWSDYWDKLTTQMAGGNAPDIISMHPDYVSDYARRNGLLDLDKYVDSGVLNLDDFTESVRDSGKIDEKLYMVSQGVSLGGQMYNTALFDQLGVDYPNMNWTWDDFVQKATDITEALKSKGQSKGHWGVTDESTDFGLFHNFVREKGKDLYTSDGKLAFDKNDLVEWFTMWDEMREKGIIPDAATSNEYASVSLEQSLFAKEKVAIAGAPGNQLYLYQQQVKNGKVNMVRQPTMEDGENGEYVGGAYLSVSANSKHPREAAKFIDFFVNSEKSLKIFKVEQGIPGSTKMTKFVKPLLDPAQRDGVDYVEKALQYAGQSPYPPVGSAEITTAFNNAATSIAYGKASIKQAADHFMTTAGRILNQ
ncbi:multiple sugar transport system substrate-binding protein [Pullulanibacillus pueri]|uniref:ABC transporter ATP-binding protein n=1 Tax=Pullulanibacillus pueri TaxID=1437324 RepID=A0A8J2ZW00_9BACL|nr:sugar ABC transporter substrate-binding protein [Pullulanibacillus pueri]MBM7682596.1 multiple sugar transport system substrate-binding protein [Pullulanibacillus pueri]GGH82445.1 ABC transporter ATP-binding protein [Pullulanibacillus pueri]